MIPLPRSVARSCRAVFRRALGPGTPAQARPLVVLSATPGQLVLHSQAGGTVVAYRLPGEFTPGTMALAGQVLQDVEAKNNTPDERQL